MAYYTAFVTAWNSATQPPAGVTGTALTGGMTTAQKLAAVNAWTVTGSIPTTMYASGADVANCINWTEFAALTDSQRQNLMSLCATGGNTPSLLGGSANTSHLLPGMIIAYFPGGGSTITALTALAKATTQPWWQYAGYARTFDLGDCAAAGVS